MGIGDFGSDEFSEIWESQGLGERVDGLEKTATMKSDRPTRRASDSKQKLVDELPGIVEEADTGEMPEITLKGTIGEGGMAKVWAAEQVPLGREVAVKVLRSRDGGKGNVLSILQEAWVTGRLEHPNIVPVYRLGRDEDGEPTIVMKRIEGVPWSDLLDDPSLAPREFDAEDPLDWHLDILIEVCNAVEYAHSQGVIHRDLKPGNIMVGAFGEVYLLDWGLAVALEEDAEGRLPLAADVDTPVGTPGYIAPEMLSGVGNLLSHQTDIYLLGGILHRIVTGAPPHEGEGMFDILRQAYESELFEYEDDVPEGLAEIATRAMARKPKDRYDSAETFRQAIVAFKRRREAVRLSESARGRLEQLEELLRGEEEPSGEVVQEIFGECRFGFERALEVSEDNDDARRGLQRTLEAMIVFELDREGYEAASRLVSDLPERNEGLEERVEDLGERLESREREYEELKTFKRESDVDLGRSARSLLALALGILWALLGYGPVFTRRWLGFELGFGAYLLQGIVVGGFLAVAFWVGRKRLFQNEANQKLLVALLLVFGVEWLVRYALQSVGMSMAMTMAVEMMMSGMGAGIIATTLDRRIWAAAVPYLVGGWIAIGYLPWIHEINGLTNLVGMGALAVAWWPRD